MVKKVAPKRFNLGKFPPLSKLQKHASWIEKVCGHDADTVKNKCLLLGEEIGELFKAIRKSEGLRIEEKSKVGELEEELADVLIHLFGIANRFGINLEKAYKDKQKSNLKRNWSKR